MTHYNILTIFLRYVYIDFEQHLKNLKSLLKFNIFALMIFCCYTSALNFIALAEVVKLVNTRDLKSLDFGLAGSSPALGTNFFFNPN